MEVVAIDLTPVKPYTTQYVSLAIGKSPSSPNRGRPLL
jgi:hypothetical protein